MQKKLEGKLLKRFLFHLEKEFPEFYAELQDDPENELYLTKIEAKSTYSADIPERMIAFFRGGYLDKQAIVGVVCSLPTIDIFCVIEKINVDMIPIWEKQYKELRYAIKVANIIIENLLQNETLGSRNASGALAILKARVGGIWKDEKETSRNQTFNIIMGNLADVQGRPPPVPVIEPEIVNTETLRLEAAELVDPKTIDHVISVETRVDVIGKQVEENRENIHKGRAKRFAKVIKTRNKRTKREAKNAIKSEINDFLSL